MFLLLTNKHNSSRLSSLLASLSSFIGCDAFFMLNEQRVWRGEKKRLFTHLVTLTLMNFFVFCFFWHHYFPDAVTTCRVLLHPPQPCPPVSREAADCWGRGLCQALWVTSPQSLGQAAVKPEAKPPAIGDVTLPEKQRQHPARPPLIQLTADYTSTSCTGHMVMIHIRQRNCSCDNISCKNSI